MEASPETSPATLVRTLFEHLNARDLDAMRPYAAEDEVQDLPMVGHIEGRGAVFEHFEAVIASLPDIHFDIEEVLGEGETAIAVWRLTGTFSGAPFYGVAPTGRRIDIRGMDRFTIRDGKVLAVFAAYDSMDFSIQAGLLPPMESRRQRAMVLAINALTAMRRR
jgi:predicted ester cyclase